ncbi:MAG: PEP/pyruvate-binding domain-containing protein [Candidatus Fermentibacteraceae bacterium]
MMGAEGGNGKPVIYGSGGIGGKASGLFFAMKTLEGSRPDEDFSSIPVFVPPFRVISTDYFDDFIERNGLHGYGTTSEPDDRIASAFMKGDIPPVLVGDLMSFIMDTRTPLAVRSSSLLEDARNEPFAGIYQTKMIPNNQPSDAERFKKLVEAIKFVWASTFFQAARDYLGATGHTPDDEKMAVILQDVVGRRFDERFYPVISGVCRSFNYYAFGRAKPADGVVNLALGLGKSIVEGDPTWSYSPAYPRVHPPYGNLRDLMKITQTTFWAVNMGRPPAYDPLLETEYMVKCQLSEADYDNTLRPVASTYDASSDRLVHGVQAQGPRVVTFDPVLKDGMIPLNGMLRHLMALCEEKSGSPVEIEFAIEGYTPGAPSRLAFLQVRPIVATDSVVEITPEEEQGGRVLLKSSKAMGNGERNDISCVLYMKPGAFDAARTPQIAREISEMNRGLSKEGKPYLLMGFGRWGSSDPWLGVGVTWGQISGAKVMVEISGGKMKVDLSQGSHFFHNLSSFGVSYFSVSEAFDGSIDWSWLASSGKTISETVYLKCVELEEPLLVKVDGRKGKGVILK